MAKLPSNPASSKKPVSTHDEITDEIVAALLSPSQSLSLAEKAEEEIDYDKENTKLSYEIRLQRKIRREAWDTTLRCLVLLGFFISYLLIICIGFGWLNFGDSSFAVPSVVAAGVLQTFGLAKLAVQYFFTDDAS